MQKTFYFNQKQPSIVGIGARFHHKAVQVDGIRGTRGEGKHVIRRFNYSDIDEFEFDVRTALKRGADPKKLLNSLLGEYEPSHFEGICLSFVACVRAEKPEFLEWAAKTALQKGARPYCLVRTVIGTVSWQNHADDVFVQSDKRLLERLIRNINASELNLRSSDRHVERALVSLARSFPEKMKEAMEGAGRHCEPDCKIAEVVSGAIELARASK